MVLHIPSIHSLKSFCPMCEVNGGFIMFLPCRRTHQGQENLNKCERQTLGEKKSVALSFVVAMNWLSSVEKSINFPWWKAWKKKSFWLCYRRVLVSKMFAIKMWQLLGLLFTKNNHLERTGMLCQQAVKNTYFLILDLLTSPTATFS